MSKTIADASRDYRKRRAAKLERLEVLEAVYEQACAALLEHDAGGVTLAGWRGLRQAVAEVSLEK